ncbi:SAF domain-containing protein [Alicyclobacillus kakegawensis]|uniref:SAF domain-containing protein n=1 Tax=Alicyclobacillus kakegawensis TaxID=392012 RepID=UPI000837005E|nr:SAF domain-containing protein [Alicyclobacillus kakegawensis]
MNQPKVMRMAAVVLLAAAAATGSFAVYRAQRTEPVLVATHNIAPYSFVTSKDFSVQYIPAAAVSSDAVHTASQVNGRMTTLGILAGSQVRMGMFSQANSMQGMVDATSQPGQVTFGLSYKPGSIDSYVAPGTYVDLAAPGPNGSVLHADHVHVLSNTGYNQTVNNSGTSNNQNQNEMLIMTISQSQYMAMEQAISGGSVQVLMVSQHQKGNSANSSTANAEATTNTSSTTGAGSSSSSISPEDDGTTNTTGQTSSQATSQTLSSSNTSNPSNASAGGATH